MRVQSGILAVMDTLDTATLAWLASAAGQAVLAELATRPLHPADLLREQTRLRATLPPAYARAALEQAVLRRHARPKIAHAERLYFTREALEQATSTPVAQHRATRFAAFTHLADVGAGIGGDALCLAAARPDRYITAIERDPLRAALLQMNVAALGLAQQVAVRIADVVATPEALPSADALFCDPGRRSGGRRSFTLSGYQPSLAQVLGWRTQPPQIAHMGIKLAAGVDLEAVAALAPQPHEIEFVALDGELKEAVLWCGELAQTRRRATLLHRTDPDSFQVTTHTLTPDTPRPLPATAEPAALLYEPDPAVIRAGLVAELAVRLHATLLDPQIAYLTAPHATPTPFARAWRILEWLPFQLKQVRARLRALDAGAVTVKKRGSPLDTDALARQLSGSGSHPLVLVLTRLHNRPIVLICEPFGAG